MIVMLVTSSGERRVFTPVNHVGHPWDQVANR